MQTHLPKVRRWKCNVENCRKAYAWKSDLRRHQVERHQIFPFKCDYCETKFKIYDQLREHLNNGHFTGK
jgi:aspartate carbamoyltransferase regulatory subunit